MKKTRKLADAQQGWVKLYRSTLDTPMMRNSKLFHIYGWALMRANHQARWVSFPIGSGSKEIKVEMDQFIMGRKRAAEFLGMPESTFYANIRKLQDYGVLSIKSNNHFSIVTLLNTDNVDDHKSADEQPDKSRKSNSKTTGEQPANTNNNYKNENNKIINNNLNNENSKAVSINNKDQSQLNESRVSDPFIEQAYSEFNDRIRNEYPSIKRTLNQISTSEFKTLLTIYDWADIFHKLDHLETWDGLRDQHSVYKILRTFLDKDKKVSRIPDIKMNTRYADWEHQQWMLEQEIEQQKVEQKRLRKLKRQQQFFIKVKDAEIWDERYSNYDADTKKEIVHDYFIFRDKLKASEKLGGIFKLRDLSLEHYLDFRILDYNPVALCRFIDDFENWGKMDESLSFYENYGEYLIERSEQSYDR